MYTHVRACVCVHRHAHHSLYVAVRGQPAGVTSFLPLCGFWGPNAGSRADAAGATLYYF